MDEGISLNVVNGRNEGSTSTGKQSWVVEINDKLGNIYKNSAIYRRPLNVREGKDSDFLYTPRIVSFGPYHHASEYCQQTNKIKELVFLHCVERYSKRRDDYIDALREDVKNLKEAYNKLEPKWEQDEDAFLRLMVFDGCFLLHILREGNHLGHLSHQVLAAYEISPNELIEYYKHDMLLLENQLPMQVLAKLLAVQNDSSVEEVQERLYMLILGFIAPLSPDIVENLPRQKGESMHIHVLDLYRRSLLHRGQREGRSIFQTAEEEEMTLFSLLDRSLASNGACLSIIYTLIFLIFLSIGVLTIFSISFIVLLLLYLILAIRYYLYFRLNSRIPVRDIYFIIPSATELHKVGIEITTNDTKSLKDISFRLDILELPRIYVDRATQSRFLNIIAFEQLHSDAENIVTSYIYFMSRLLQAAGDVRLLQLCDIIRTTLHKDEVVELFKSLNKDINVHDPDILLVQNYGDVGIRLSRNFYYRMKNLWERGFWQFFNFENPWTLISLVAALSLFGLAAVQTIYTVLSYYNSK